MGGFGGNIAMEPARICARARLSSVALPACSDEVLMSEGKNFLFAFEGLLSGLGGVEEKAFDVSSGTPESFI